MKSFHSHCNGNPAQYERNRRFGYLVHVLGREANGAKLPSEGLELNASKLESRPEKSAMILSALCFTVRHRYLVL